MARHKGQAPFQQLNRLLRGVFALNTRTFLAKPLPKMGEYTVVAFIAAPSKLNVRKRIPRLLIAKFVPCKPAAGLWKSASEMICSPQDNFGETKPRL